MWKDVQLALAPAMAADKNIIEQKAIRKSGYQQSSVGAVEVLKRSIDARGRQPLLRLVVRVYSGPPPPPSPTILSRYSSVAKKQEVIIVGAGPAGYFAALELIELGLRPVILERGKDVQARRKDLKGIQQDGIVNPDSNYCFGEGGAGTYSDGKLYTRSHKRGNIEKALKLLVEHGAQSEILIDAHPHIGSNKLPKVVANIRATIEQFGGSIHFNQRVVDFMLSAKKDKILGVKTQDEQLWQAPAVVLATGHSARDIYKLLQLHGVRLESKPFAVGVRIEHPQPLIDRLQYNQDPRSEYLPAASYKLVTQVKDRGVFSFCMCPGGMVVPAATAPGEIVVNGMSMSRRDSPYANSGTVVAVDQGDYGPYQKDGIFAGLSFQKSIEQKMFTIGDGGQQAPAQRLTDFVKGKVSSDLPGASYIPGLISSPLHDILPPFLYEHLKQGVVDFGKKMKGYFTEEANVIGTESRTSSPLRIPRNPKTMMHDEVEGLFPSGEGAGFAGGIISAAMDGQKVASRVVEYLK